MTLRIPNTRSAEGKSWKLNWSVTRLLNEEGTLFSRATQLKFKSAAAVYFVHRPALGAELFRRPEF
jgi:hypothetical protein